jgi:hypothetical protein
MCHFYKNSIFEAIFGQPLFGSWKCAISGNTAFLKQRFQKAHFLESPSSCLEKCGFFLPLKKCAISGKTAFLKALGWGGSEMRFLGLLKPVMDRWHCAF